MTPYVPKLNVVHILPFVKRVLVWFFPNCPDSGAGYLICYIKKRPAQATRLSYNSYLYYFKLKLILDDNKFLLLLPFLVWKLNFVQLLGFANFASEYQKPPVF